MCAHATRPTPTHPGGTALTAWSHTLAAAPPQMAAEGASRTVSKQHKSVDADEHLQDATRTAHGQLLRASARPSTHAGGPAGWRRTAARQTMRQPPPNRPRQPPQRGAEHDGDEALHEERARIDGAELGALSK